MRRSGLHRVRCCRRELEVFSIFDANDGNLVVEWIDEDGTHGEAVGVGYGGVFGADDLHGGPRAGIRVRWLRHDGVTVECSNSVKGVVVQTYPQSFCSWYIVPICNILARWCGCETLYRLGQELQVKDVI